MSPVSGWVSGCMCEWEEKTLRERTLEICLSYGGLAWLTLVLLGPAMISTGLWRCWSEPECDGDREGRRYQLSVYSWEFLLDLRDSRDKSLSLPSFTF